MAARAERGSSGLGVGRSAGRGGRRPRWEVRSGRSIDRHSHGERRRPSAAVRDVDRTDARGDKTDGVVTVAFVPEPRNPAGVGWRRVGQGRDKENTPSHERGDIRSGCHRVWPMRRRLRPHARMSSAIQYTMPACRGVRPPSPGNADSSGAIGSRTTNVAPLPRPSLSA
jgi:hypothetical protein